MTQTQVTKENVQTTEEIALITVADHSEISVVRINGEYHVHAKFFNKEEQQHEIFPSKRKLKRFLAGLMLAQVNSVVSSADKE